MSRPAGSSGVARSGVLADGYRRLSAGLDGVTVRAGHLGGIGLGDLARPEVLKDLITSRGDWLTNRYGTAPRPDVAAYSAMLQVLWLAGLALAGPYVLDAVVPRPLRLAVSPDLTVVGIEPAVLACLAADPLAADPLANGPHVCGPRFGDSRAEAPRPSVSGASDPQCVVVRGGDPRGGVTGVLPVAGIGALRHELRTSMAGVAAPVLDAFAPHLRRAAARPPGGAPDWRTPGGAAPGGAAPGGARGRAALWAAATDQFVSALWSVGRAFGAEERAVSQARALLPGPGWPDPRPAGFRRLEWGDGRSALTRVRNTCCRYYTLVDPPPCLTCPRIDDAERRRRLSTDLGRLHPLGGTQTSKNDYRTGN